MTTRATQASAHAQPLYGESRVSTFLPKLAYVPINNFGDALNPWIWQKLLGPRIDASLSDCAPSALQGPASIASIGSYLDEGFLGQFSASRRIAIAGTGIGYGQTAMRFSAGRAFPYSLQPYFALPISSSRAPSTQSTRFYWVRGPLTSHLLGLPHRLAIADAAYLVRKAIKRDELPTRGDRVAYMPHISTCKTTTHRKVCEQLNIDFIDPESDRMTILASIARARVLVTEALHGAIVSDSLRTPWVPVVTSQNILGLKWIDHCASIGIRYNPLNLATQWIPSEICKTQRSAGKKVVYNVRARWHNRFVLPSLVAQNLLTAAASPPFLSSDDVIERIDEQLEEKVEILKRDIESDPFFHCS